MPDKAKKRTKEDKAKKMLKEEKTIIDLELAIKKEEFKKTIMNERKCNDCDEKATNHFEDKWYCLNHHSDAKRKSNKKYERTIFIKKCVIVGGGIIAIMAGTIVLYQFVANF